MAAPWTRQLWWRLEPLHAVTYFADDCRRAASAIGLRGFWMGYFANRAAPMGAVGPGVVTAAFYNFAPAMVQRAIPDAWTFATPTAVLGQRRQAAAGVLERVCGGATAGVAARVAALLTEAVGHGRPEGRPLFAANRPLVAEGAPSGDPWGSLWQATTAVREHRGDGHVAALSDAGLGGCEVHVLLAAARRFEPALFTASRGWSDGDWAAASDRLHHRKLLGPSGLTTAGHQLHASIERRTDELAAQPFERLDEGGRRRLFDGLGELAAHVAAAGVIAYPNPMGLPPGPA